MGQCGSLPQGPPGQPGCPVITTSGSGYCGSNGSPGWGNTPCSPGCEGVKGQGFCTHGSLRASGFRVSVQPRVPPDRPRTPPDPAGSLRNMCRVMWKKPGGSGCPWVTARSDPARWARVGAKLSEGHDRSTGRPTTPRSTRSTPETAGPCGISPEHVAGDVEKPRHVRLSVGHSAERSRKVGAGGRSFDGGRPTARARRDRPRRPPGPAG